jgi:AAA domain
MEAQTKRIRRAAGNRMVLTPASAIKPKPVRWLWADRHPLRYLSLVVGKPDLGKSQFGVWESAQLTRGTLPGHFHGQPRGVIYVATEDSWDDTIVPRLIAAGADLDRVFRVDSAEQEGKGYTLNLVRDLDHLWQLITKYGIGLTYFDPLVEVVGGSSWNKAEEVREALRPLAEMLRDTDSSAVGLMHYRKQVSEDVLTQIAGSGAWGQIVRAVTAFARAPEDEDAPVEKTVIVSQAKSNLGRGDQPNLTFTFKPVDVPTDEGTAHVSRIEWGDDSAWSAEDILTGRHKAQDKSKTTVERCIEWLKNFLGDGKPVLIDDVEAAGEALGYNKRMIGRAKRKLDIITERVGGSNGPSTWRLVP